MRHSFQISRRAFTLVELLVVVVIVMLLVTASIAALGKISSKRSLVSAADAVIGQLNLARQTAMSRNRQTEVRFYELPDAGGAMAWRAMQIFIVLDGSPSALARPVTLPAPVCIASSATLSNLLDDERADIINSGRAEPQLPEAGLNYNYRAFRFKPDGSTSLATAVFVTLRSVNSQGDTLPPDWLTVQVDAVNGRVKTFRP